MTLPRLHTRTLLAVRYLPGREAPTALSHSFPVDAQGDVIGPALCGRPAASACDPCAQDVTAAPTCRRCARLASVR